MLAEARTKNRNNNKNNYHCSSNSNRIQPAAIWPEQPVEELHDALECMHVHISICMYVCTYINVCVCLCLQWVAIASRCVKVPDQNGTAYESAATAPAYIRTCAGVQFQDSTVHRPWQPLFLLSEAVAFTAAAAASSSSRITCFSNELIELHSLSLFRWLSVCTYVCI